MPLIASRALAKLAWFDRLVAIRLALRPFFQVQMVGDYAIIFSL
jgi:hypothetical protein